MRDPTLRISQVHERCDFDDREFERNVRLEFNPRASEAISDEPNGAIYVDLVSPEKGALIDVQIAAGSNARRLSHDEHQAVSQYLIYFRFVSVWKSCRVPKRLQGQFMDEMNLALLSLLDLPRLPQKDAVELLNHWFDPERRALRPLLRAPNAQVNTDKMDGLFRLCEMLATRYLILAEFRPSSASNHTLEYRYRHASKDSPDRPPELPPVRRISRLRAWAQLQRLKLNSYLRELFGIPPIHLRIHTPWAKRTNHYYLEVTAPVDYFFSAHLVLAAPREEARRSELAPPNHDVRWSRNSNVGRRAYAFIQNGRLEGSTRALFVWHQILELPGRSTFRVTLTSWVIAFALAALGALQLVGKDNVSDVPALVVATLSLVAFVLENAFPTKSLHGPPLVARLAPLLLLMISLLFAIWIIWSNRLVVSVVKRHGAVSVDALVWAEKYALWIPLVVAALIVAVLTTRRYRHLRRAYRDAAQQGTGSASDMY